MLGSPRTSAAKRWPCLSAQARGFNKWSKEIAETRWRYGYRRIHVLLRRGRSPINGSRLMTLQGNGPAAAQESVQAAGEREAEARLLRGSRVNDLWAMGYAHHQLATGPKLRS